MFCLLYEYSYATLLYSSIPAFDMDVSKMSRVSVRVLRKLKRRNKADRGYPSGTVTSDYVSYS